MIKLILLIIAIVCFILYALKAPDTNVNWLGLGLAFFAGSFLPF